MNDAVRFVMYECPKCGWLISEIERTYARVDFDCPRCGGARFSEFVKSKFGQKKERGEPEDKPED